MPRIICAAVYAAELKETMRFLWDSHMRINTVHVHDVARALYLLATTQEKLPQGTVFNLSDRGDRCVCLS